MKKMPTLLEQLNKLKTLMHHYELVADVDNKWCIRDHTDEGLGGSTSFRDEDLEIAVDRAIRYYEDGPGDEVKKAAQELSIRLETDTKIYGDVIMVIYDYINGSQEMIDRVEDGIQELGYRYKGFEIDFRAPSHNSQ